MTILILEDDQSFRETLAEALEERGYQVLQARSGAQALALAEEHRLQLVLADVRMGGMDGIDTLERLRERQPGLKSVVMTGFACESAPGRAMQAETGDYLLKPFGLEELTLVVERTLRAGPEGQGYRRLLRRLGTEAAALVSFVRLKGLEGHRHKTFQAFYVAVRSKLLTQREAHDRWGRLLALEARRERLRREWCQQSSGLLAEGYRTLARLLGSRAALDPLLDGTHTAQDLIRFGGLYLRVLAGRISVEQLKLAPALSVASEAELARSKRLAALRLEVWGP